jgi:hypothetical protein
VELKCYITRDEFGEAKRISVIKIAAADQMLTL